MICRRSFVSGRVQGVYFRGSCVRRAETLGIRGFARNLPDGRVEVLACGAPAAVEAFLAWLWEGSPMSKVAAVETTEADPAEAGAGGFISA